MLAATDAMPTMVNINPFVIDRAKLTRARHLFNDNILSPSHQLIVQD
jgi:hypothetical protein